MAVTARETNSNFQICQSPRAISGVLRYRSHASRPVESTVQTVSPPSSTTTMSSVQRIARARSALRARKLASSSSISRTYATRSPATLDKPEEDPLLNGYPQLPNVSRQSLPATGWWDVAARRNMGDTVR